MSIARNSFFSSNQLSSLYEKACTEDGYKEIGIQEMMELFAEVLQVPKESFFTSNLVEEMILKHIMAIEGEACSSIPSDINITKAYWHVNDPYSDNALVIRYPELSLSQRQQIADAYNKHYGSMAVPYEYADKGGFCADNLDGIIFSKRSFCKNVLKNLSAPTLESRFDIRFNV